MLLRTSVKEVHEPDLAEHERQNCPTSFNLDAVTQGLGRQHTDTYPRAMLLNLDFYDV